MPPPLTFDDALERGLLGVAFDPDFPSTPYVYIYYSVCKVPGADECQIAKNRVARVTAGYEGNPDRADPSSLVAARRHRLIWHPQRRLRAADGKLYVSVGDGNRPPSRRTWDR